MTTQVRVDGVTKTYGAGASANQVLNGVTLSLDQGQIGALLGPSGSGKSTLMNIVGGLDRADAGTVEVAGIAVTGLSDAALTDYRRDQVGFIFQFYNLLPQLTVAENIEVVAQLAKQPLELAPLLEAVGLADKHRSFPRQLSGGEQQRVAIARAIVKNPVLLLCDEPTGALDSETARAVLALLQRINRDWGTTIIMVTHNTAIGAMADQVYRMRDGAITQALRNEQTMAAERIEW
jgi:putative ABC transport system ATP-binding protein